MIAEFKLMRLIFIQAAPLTDITSETLKANSELRHILPINSIGIRLNQS